jgi:oxygen-independent coproporphyrinogen-3 oxidase
MPAGLYIHLPFCEKKCWYCDYQSNVIENPEKNYEQQKKYALKLLDDFEMWAETEAELLSVEKEQEVDFDTIYVGGGTPSFFDDDLLEKVIKGVEKIVIKKNISALSESSIEVNPEHFNSAKADLYLTLGFNRISLGVQSLNRRALKILGRNTEIEKTIDAYNCLRESNFKYKSVDFIFGYPGQTENELFSDLDNATDAKFNHISVYGLSIENNCKYKKLVDEFVAGPPDENFIAEMLPCIRKFFKKKNYLQYEVSNYSRPNEYCVHNLHYWKLEPCLGFGSSAHGLWRTWRYLNSTSLQSYLIQKSFYSSREMFSLRKDLAVTLFRLLVFWPLDILIDPLGGDYYKLLHLLKNLQRQNIVKLVSGEEFNLQNYRLEYEISENIFGPVQRNFLYFQWETEALIFLDSYIFEIYNILN